MLKQATEYILKLSFEKNLDILALGGAVLYSAYFLKTLNKKDNELIVLELLEDYVINKTISLVYLKYHKYIVLLRELQLYYKIDQKDFSQVKAKLDSLS